MSASSRLQIAVEHVDKANEAHRRIQALSNVLGAASRQSEIDIEDSLIEVSLILWDLVENAAQATNQLFEIIREVEQGGADATT